MNHWTIHGEEGYPLKGMAESWNEQLNEILKQPKACRALLKLYSFTDLRPIKH
jgi:hypothetical protein